jgi:hypothetical protein
VGRANLTFINHVSVGTPNVVFASGFTYTGSNNGTGTAAEADYCNLQHPVSLSVKANTTTPQIFGQLYEAGVTESAGEPSGVQAEVGYGNSNTDPRVLANNWRFFPATYNVQVGNNDEFVGTFVAPSTATNYSYTFRFSFDGGLRWTYCDLNGAGSNTGLSFEPTTQLGPMTVTP